MNFNQPSYSQMGMGAGPNSYFPFNVAALASMSNQQLEVSNELHMLFSHSFSRQLIVTCVFGHRHLACALPGAVYWGGGGGSIHLTIPILFKYKKIDWFISESV